MQSITPHINQIINQYSAVHTRAVVFGAGLAYAIPNGLWHHTPLILLNPFAYAAYQVFVSQKDVVKWGKETFKELTTTNEH